MNRPSLVASTSQALSHNIRWNRSVSGWLTILVLNLTLVPAAAFGQFDLQLSITNPNDFSATELAITQEAMLAAEALWESEITGYQPGITQTALPITITGTTTGFAEANGTGTVVEGGFTIHQSGAIRINRGILEDFADFRGEGLNVIDELMAHEIGHALGIGITWTANGVYVQNSGQYTGQYGLAAYQNEFDPTATFIPVELAGPAGSRNSHWDQILRSAGEAGPNNTGDPFGLSPLTGIVDSQGRDLAGELLTAALDPDIGEPFLSRFTVESLRDIGFEVRAIPEPSAALVWITGATLLSFQRRRKR